MIHSASRSRRRRPLYAAAVALLLSAAVSSCGVPSGVIPPKKMARLMADVHIGEAVVEQHRSQYPDDSTKQLLKQSIYARYGYTQADVDSSLSWYGRHIDRYAEVYEQVEKNLEADLAEANRLAASGEAPREIQSFLAEGDSVDVWTSTRSMVFAPGLPSDRLTFDLKSDRYWETGDIYTLRFKAVNVPDRLSVVMAVEYTDGTTAYIAEQPSGDGWHEVSLFTSESRTASGIHGSIAYDTRAAKPSGDPTLRPVVEAAVDSVMLIRRRDDLSAGVRRGNQHVFNRRN